MSDSIEEDLPERPARPHYDRDFVETAFTPEKIAEQGQYLLFRALNINRAIGFIGSGVPAAFGRPTWSTLIDEISEEVHGRDNLPSDVQATSQSLSRASVPGVSDPDLLPLRAHMLKVLSLDGHGPQNTDQDDPVEARIKEQTRDDDFIARRAWRALFTGLWKDFPYFGLQIPAGSAGETAAEKLEKEQAFDSDLAVAVWRALDTPKVLGCFAELVSKDHRSLSTVLKQLAQALLAKVDDSKPVRLSPEERILVPLLTALTAAQPAERRRAIAHELIAAAGVDEAEASPAERSQFLELWRSADAPRPDELNPIDLLLDRLQINRLITTNYDFELERGLEKLGFGDEIRPRQALPHRHVEGSRSPTYKSNRPRGDTARSTVFEHETAADLIDFAVHGSEFDYEVFHLHGRAGPGDPMVVTERDYQLTYMRDTPESQAMREALQVAFAGNPIIFLGMGMLEADVLRPLRRFVSDPTGRVNRSIIALLPTEESKERRTSTALQLYLRYGVHVVFFGESRPERPERAGADGRRRKRTHPKIDPVFVSAPWLGERSREQDDQALLYRAITRLRDFNLALDNKPAGSRAELFDWLAKPAEKNVDAFVQPVLDMLDKEGDRDKVLRLMIKALVASLSDEAVREVLKSGDPGALSRQQLSEFLWALDGRLRTRALCEALEHHGEGRAKWWRQWRRLPIARRFAPLVEMRKKSADPRPDPDPSPRGWHRARDGEEDKGPETGAWKDIIAPEYAYRIVRFGICDTEPAPSMDPKDPVRDVANDIFETLATARRDQPAQKPPIVIVRADSGAGRGSLFHYLGDEFERAPEDGSTKGYGWGLFINSAFSIEYSSVVDGAIDFFWRSVQDPHGSDAHLPLNDRRPRVEALRHYIQILKNARAEKIKDSKNTEHKLGSGDLRGLVVITSVEFLFRRHGTAKNHDIIDAIRELLSLADNDLFDVVLICREDRCAAVFAPPSASFAPDYGAAKDGESIDQVGGHNTLPIWTTAMGYSCPPLPTPPPHRDEPDPSIPRRDIKFVLGRGNVLSGESPEIHEGYVLDLRYGKLDERTKWALQRLEGDEHGVFKADAKKMLDLFEIDRDPTSGRRVDLRVLDGVIKGRFPAILVAACALETHQAQKNEEDKLEATLTFLANLSDASARTGDDNRATDLILSNILRQYVRLGKITGADGEEICPSLCEVILKHLAIVSGPVEAGVLLRCPEIRQRLAAAHEAQAGVSRWEELDEEQQFERVRHALRRLHARRLIFRMKARSDAPDDAHDAGRIDFHTRYAAHQSLQSYFFRQIGSPHLVFGDSRLFTVSLFASQSAELPTPSEEGYKFMMDLIENLAMHPRSETARLRARELDHRKRLQEEERAKLKKEGKRVPPAQPIRPTPDQRLRDVCALRAAVSLTRSAFSLGVISRLGDVLTPRGGPPAFGYLERYRLLIRWMIYQAGDLGEQRTDAEKAELNKTQLNARTNALYQDEITWLYNECALASYTQGNLYDAMALFGQAERSNRWVEVGSPDAPNALRIRLNLAMVQIERGNLSRAKTELDRITEASGREPVVLAIATGYKGLVAHLRGRFKQAAELYDTAIRALRHLHGEARALSIFSKHYADMLRNQKDNDGARELLRTALAEAETAGQQDQVQRVRISQALFELSDKAAPPDTLRRVQRQLRTIERYADVMEIHSLKVDVLTTRARVFEMQGETRMSGENAVEGLALATLHGLKLRVMAALAMIGRITWERGYLQQARQISTTARRMAERAGYQLSVARADEVLVEAAEPGTLPG